MKLLTLFTQPEASSQPELAFLLSLYHIKLFAATKSSSKYSSTFSFRISDFTWSVILKASWPEECVQKSPSESATTAPAPAGRIALFSVNEQLCSMVLEERSCRLWQIRELLHRFVVVVTNVVVIFLEFWGLLNVQNQFLIRCTKH